MQYYCTYSSHCQMMCLCVCSYLDEYDVGCLHSHVSASPNGYAHISLCQSWRVVNTVSHHRHLFSKSVVISNHVTSNHF